MKNMAPCKGTSTLDLSFALIYINFLSNVKYFKFIIKVTQLSVVFLLFHSGTLSIDLYFLIYCFQFLFGLYLKDSNFESLMYLYTELFQSLSGRIFDTLCSVVPSNGMHKLF